MLCAGSIRRRSRDLDDDRYRPASCIEVASQFSAKCKPVARTSVSKQLDRKRRATIGFSSTSMRCQTTTGVELTPVAVASLRKTWSFSEKIHVRGLDPPGATTATLRPPPSADLNTPRIDSYRFSMANLEDSQDVELDAILGELCALESQYDEAIAAGSTDRVGPGKRTSAPVPGSNPVDGISQNQQNQHCQLRSHTRSSSDGQRHNTIERDSICKNGSVRTDSPDNDSAFSDNVSMLSSESSASSGGSGGQSDIKNSIVPSPTQMDSAKEEKIRIAMEKIREAAVQKLFIKVFTSDGSTKSLLVDEKMTVGYVTRLLADKNHVSMEPKWCVLEHLPDLYMERIYEDHEFLVENLMMWTRDSKNKLYFLEKIEERTRLFLSPEQFLLNTQDGVTYDDHARAILLEEFFSSTGVGVPEVEGPLYIKSESKKGWKKYHCVLRASGLYHYPKEKAKLSSRDLACLATFDVNQVYYGVGWKKKHKAPTDFCFAIKHPKLQQPKSTKHIKFLCAEDAETLHRWVVGIRIAKYGRQLQENYRSLSEELAQEELDRLAKARSCSVASIQVAMTSSLSTGSANATGQHGLDLSSHHVPSSGASSSSSSGCLSDGALSSSTEQDQDIRSSGGFECEFPSGTIKRKPSAIPQLPLTSTTRQLIENGENNELDSGGTLTRRLSRRRSTLTDADGASIGSSNSNCSTLKRHTSYTSTHSSSSGSTIVKTPTEYPSSPVTSPGITTAPSSPMRAFEDMPVSTPSGDISPVDALSCAQAAGCVQDDENSDFESLPLPPPPELSQSTLSLDSLPPPPPPSELPIYASSELSGSSLSLSSLPPPPPSPPLNDDVPPPPQPVYVSPQRTGTLTRKISFKLPPISDDYEEGSLTPSPTVQTASPPEYDQPVVSHSNGTYCSGMPELPPQMPELPLHPSLQGKAFNSPPSVLKPNIYASAPMPPSSGKKISFNLSPSHNSEDNGMTTMRKTASLNNPKKISFKLPSPSDEDPPILHQPPILSHSLNSKKKSSLIYATSNPVDPLAAPPLFARKPPPPRRSENTRLSNPMPTPQQMAPQGAEFLKDLQKVMRRKWQVAQKCKQDHTTTPHEVLGFRDPPPPVADYRETNVSNWVQEHYGNGDSHEEPVDNLYENVFTKKVAPHSTNNGTVAVYAPNGHPHATSCDIRTALPHPGTGMGHAAAHPGVTHHGVTHLGVTHPGVQQPMAHSAVAIAAAKKRPPPPPPKRSETTQLTTACQSNQRFAH